MNSYLLFACHLHKLPDSTVARYITMPSMMKHTPILLMGIVLAQTVAHFPVAAFAPSGTTRIVQKQNIPLIVAPALTKHATDIQTGLHPHAQSSFLHASQVASLPDDESDEIKMEQQKKNIFSKFVGMLKPQKSENLSTKELLKKMGLSMFLSYGFVSNITSVIITSLSWFTFSKKSGMSPLAPGQWKGFLAIYAGFYVFSSLLRPLRVGLAIGISKYFDSALNQIQEKMNCPRPVAIGILVVLANILVTCAVMALGVSLASVLSGVPVFPPKL